MKKKKLIIAVVFLIYSFLTGCMAIDSGINSDWNFDDNQESIYGSGDLITLDKQYTNFKSIEVGHAFAVRITRGEHYSVQIKIDDNLVNHLEVNQSGSTLKIGMENGYNYKDATMEADIVMPDIESLDLSGASYIYLVGFDFNHQFVLSLSGASRIDGSLNSGDVIIDLSGASSVKLEGEGKDLIINCSGASHLDFYNFKCDNAVIDLSGASVTTLNVSGNISADLSGASVLRYLGNPVFTRLQTSGGSVIIKL
jgi:hypothetical protein